MVTATFIGPAGVALRHAVRRERGEHAIDGEVLDAEAIVVDAGRRVRCRRRDGDELRARADSKDRRRVDPSLDRHAEQDPDRSRPSVSDPTQASPK
jgi:hypothetical protein